MRLESGDWVIARGVAGAASPGLGKLSGGDHRERELVRARVELASGVRWFHPSELERIEPETESRLVHAALARACVPTGERHDRLTARLADYDRGALGFVRTPGLLDALWACLSAEERAPGLVAFFAMPRSDLLAIAPGHAPRPADATPLPPAPPLRDVELPDLVARRSTDPPPPERHLGDWDGSWNDWDDEDDWDDVTWWSGRALPNDPTPPPDLPEAPPRRGRTSPIPAAELLAARREHAAAEEAGEGAWLDARHWTLAPLDRGPPRDPAPAGADEGPPADPAAPPRRCPTFPVAALADATQLAAWLGLDESDARWLADPGGWLRREPLGPLQHYHHRWLRKRSGTGRRLVEAPKARLKEVQRQVLREVLDRVPAHDAAHGFRRGRSARSSALPHAGQAFVMRLDLRAFFPSVGAGRVRAIFRALGYAEDVAELLTGLTTTVTPDAVFDQRRVDPRAIARLRRRHLPQGAPTSPALANLAAFALDRRLTGAAASWGARYTRYADDLAFSGGPTLARRARNFERLVARIASSEGFELHPGKTRWLPASRQQRLVGLVVNDRPRPSRATYDRLKAILHNCARHGPAGQNRDAHPDFRAHLAARVAWFRHLDPARGARLQASFERIAWPEQA